MRQVAEKQMDLILKEKLKQLDELEKSEEGSKKELIESLQGRKDILSVILAASRSAGSDKKNALTDEEAKGQMLTFTFVWIFYFINQFPDDFLMINFP